MPDDNLQNAAFKWSTTFVRALYEEGVRHVIISPGSRSTALTLAFSAHPGFKTHVIIDERSAAFTALGIAKESGIPAVLVCTSGTAVANYFPAVIEATQSGVPMIVASADRPPHQRGLGASQTIDQLKIFGDYPVFFHEAGEPNEREQSTKRLKMASRQAVQHAMEQEGVAHLNFAFSKPFEPKAEYLEEVEFENGKLLQPPPSYSIKQGNMELGETFWSDLVSAERPLIVVGPASASDHPEKNEYIHELAQTLKAPVIAEPGAALPSSPQNIQGFDGFLRNEKNRNLLNADLILRFGAQPVSKALNLYMEQSEAMQIVFRRAGRWNDGSLSGHKHIDLTGPIAIPEVTGSAQESWLATWKQAEQAFNVFRNEQLEPSTPLTDGLIFSTVTNQFPDESFTMLSNSFPARDMSLFGDFDGREVYMNRGAAGIDGITSTAIGLSLSSQKPGVLFVGDIAFLHDSNALLQAASVDKPLVVIVLNNGGGTIFRMLPVHDIRSKYTEYFETPQQVKIAALCRAHGIHHTLVSKPDQIAPVFHKLKKRNGLHVMECMTDAEKSMEQRHALWNFKLKLNPGS
ncbi:2-succinyl-5-enolpyruvyl-6-hydroxy-3-cyclohexene-1-carboxylic-acid synthase [Gracilimonas mengyeensis]|uniref:2-succinyl-5-enolpyruvyl-6-hydroxy-3-cyclohexene-1-carboxylate synthase n=1 Tax=Gracilimonas mengyeensis TaxID=1302730 RepID=A0A521AMR1_9BACT|nr:2-succinyl-5-enolpyruvyl-6-hydroxy-3-cyclohexene-1-carboxylic-acid synthase [Gracilimonas mengyeensis]SMO36096.1 2-succinyl-5-enolpyruvyl-6-hydroxy-3-cyclohexene-1-carboxylate synthase [Gracilimonas mengyeensis]